MKKSKKRKVASAILACAAVLTLGIASGCGGCSSCNNEKHTWDWDYDSEGHWQYCTDDGCDATTEKAPHVDEDNNGKCDVCDFTLHTHNYSQWVNTDPDQHWKECPADHTIDESTRGNHDYSNGDCICGRPNPNYVTATIHFHKPADFGDTVYAHAYYNDGETDKNLTGDWKTYEVTKTDSDGWYTIEVRHPDGLFDDGSFNLMIVPEEGSSIDVTITASEMWVNANGNLFATKSEALADEEAEKVEYTVYYYAPDWAEDEAVYVYTYNGPSVGGYNTEMTADGEGWYKLSFKTTQEFEGFNIIFHTEDEETKHEFGVTLTETLLKGKAFYFIDNGDGVYASKAEAEEAYADAPEKPEYTETATVHFHKPEGFGDKVYAHAYYNDGTGDKNLDDGWCTLEMTDEDGDGWYTVEVKHPDGLLDGGSFNLMIVKEDKATTVVSTTITASEMWVNANGNLFASKADAVADEAAVKVEYAIYYYAPDWAKGEKVYVYTYGGPIVGEYNTEMPADGKDGWYKITFETTLELTTFNVMFHTLDDKTVKRDLPVTATEALLEGKAFYFIDNSKDVYASKEDAEKAYANAPVDPVDPEKPEYTETATVHFHKPEGFGDKVYAHAYYNDGTSDKDLDDGWCTLEMTDDDGDGWYTVEVKHPDGLLDGGSFNLMIVKEDKKTTVVSTTITASEMWVSANGNLFASKEDAKADEEAEATEYAIYYYAPDWINGEKVYVYTYGGPIVGDYNTEMPADGKDGWYKITFETTLELTTFNVMFHTLDDKTVKRDLPVTATEALLEGKAFYFIDNSKDVYASKEEAVEAYNSVEVTPPEPEYTETATIHFHKPEDFGDTVYAHVYYNDGTGDKDLDDGWCTLEMTDEDGDGWYTVEVKHPDGLLDGGSFNLMIVKGDKETTVVSTTITASEMWVSANGNLFASKEDAKADEEAEVTEYTIYVYAPDWKEEKLYIHTYNGIAFTNYWSSPMEKDGDDGWYKISFETTQGISDFHYMLHNQDDNIKPDIAVTVGDDFEGTDIYLIFTTAATGSIYASREDAEAAYTPTEPTEKQDLIIHYHGNASLTVHAYYTVSGNDTPMTVWDAQPAFEADTDNEGWFIVTIPGAPKDLFEQCEFYTAMLNGEGGTNIQIGSAEAWVNAKFHVFATKDEAEADEDDSTPKAHTYTIYMYAPEATSVTIGVWGNFGGEFADGTVMTAVEGHDGWYSYTLNTDKELKEGNGINLNISVDGDNKPKYTTDANGLYFITLGGESGFADFDTAEAKYEELNNVDPSDTVSVTIHFQVPAKNESTDEWNLTGNLILHAWGDDVGALSGGWGTTTMQADTDNNGWYYVTFEEIPKAYIGKSVEFIFCDANHNTEAGFGRVHGFFTLDASGVWISSDGATVTNPNA